MYTRIPHMGWNELELTQIPKWLEEKDYATGQVMSILCIHFMHEYCIDG